MKRIRISTILFIFFIFLVTLVDLPEGKQIKFAVGPIKIDQKIPPPAVDITFFGRRFHREFPIRLGLDLKGGSRLTFEADIEKIKPEDREAAIVATRDTIERRVNLFGVSEPTIQTLSARGSERLVVELPGLQDVNEAIALIGQTAQLDFREQGTIEAALATQTPLFMQMNKATGLTGKHLKKSTVQFDQAGKPSVGLEFNSEGAKLFEDITTRNVGKPVAIFLDEFPLSIPMVQTPITDGIAIITGDFTLDEAKQLSIAINSGALPVSIRLVEQKSIGPTLGAEQVARSVFAGFVGLGAVVAFMVLFYGRLGVIASIALVIYGLITLALFKLIPVVLTLPGVAGFILSIGMAVDANILIFERIKEELRRGQEHTVAVRLGFGRAIDAIKDANITTLLVAFILFNPLNWSFFPQFGLVRGFALTLAIGVLTSLFTGVFITKRLIAAFYKKKPERSVSSAKT